MCEKKRERDRKRSLLACFMRKRVCASCLMHVPTYVRSHTSPPPPPPPSVCAVKSTRGLFFIPPRTLHRCWDACLCIAIVRKCHCWHLTATSAPTQACLLATCGPTSSAADTGSLVCSPAIPCHSPPKSGCLACSGPVKDQSGEHNSIYRGVFDWRPRGEVAAMQLHRPS